MIETESTNKISDGIISSIGNTPLLVLNRIYPHKTFNLFGKLEASNPSGSLKDRTSAYIITEAIRTNKIKHGDTIIESSSGNMALGLAQACLYYSLKLIVVVDPNLNSHTEKLLTTYGAQIVYVNEPLKNGGFLGARLAKVKQLLETIPNSFWSNQYGNLDNPKAHHSTMDEIISALDGKLDYLFVSTSTCGTIMGCANYVFEHKLPTKIVAVDAVGSVLFGGEPQRRLIPGHGAGVPSQFLNISKINDKVEVSDLDCVSGCWSLLESEGILCGGSTGGVIAAIGQYKNKIASGSNCAFLLSDRGERYLDTIYNKEWLLKVLPESKEAFVPIGGW